jgi:Fe-S-cluster containining protein
VDALERAAIAIAIREGNQKITDYTQNGECVSCAECCSRMLPMTSDELARLKAMVAKENIKSNTFIKIPQIGVDWTCPLLSQDKRCRIYENRPSICRSFCCHKESADYSGLWPSHKYRVTDMREELFGE